MQKEQSSNSTPKTKSALLDKYEKQNDEAHKKEVDGYERLKKKEAEKRARNATAKYESSS